MKMTAGRYIAGLLHGAAVGLIAGWFLNSGFAFRGSSESRLIFPAGLVLVIAGHGFNQRATGPAMDAERERSHD